VESVSKKKKRKKMKKTNQVVATRASARVPIADKAMARAKERNNFIEGNCSNSFTVLKDASTAHLRGVMLDLDITSEDIDAQIDAFRAEEAVRADLAKANYQVYLENLKRKTAPRGEDDLGDLTMEVISNANRNVDGVENDGMLMSLLPKGGSEEIPLINN
jgi:hypothetical protein